jgi:hypothetical protein
LLWAGVLSWVLMFASDSTVGEDGMLHEPFALVPPVARSGRLAGRARSFNLTRRLFDHEICSPDVKFESRMEAAWFPVVLLVVLLALVATALVTATWMSVRSPSRPWFWRVSGRVRHRPVEPPPPGRLVELGNARSRRRRPGPVELIAPADAFALRTYTQRGPVAYKCAGQSADDSPTS